MAKPPNDKVAQFMLKFKKMDKKQKTGAVLLIVLMMFVMFACFAYLVGSVIRTMQSIGSDKSLHSAFYYGFTSSGLVMTSVLFLGMLILIAVALGRRTDMVNQAAHYDERGLGYGQKPISGSSRWETDDEAATDYHVTSIEDAHNVIYGALPSDESKIVSNRPPEDGGINSDQNTLVIGSPGTGKSFAYVRTELVQTVLRGHSFVVTDPSGELYSSTSQFCRDRGMEVRVLNLENKERSDFWNCLSETINPTTGRLDGSRLNDFSDIYMKNSSDGQEDPFWFGSASNLLRAIIGYCAWEHEIEIINGLEELYRTVGSIDENFVENESKFHQSGSVAITWCKKTCLESAERNGFDVEEAKKIIKKIEDTAKPYTMGHIFTTMLTFSKVLERNGFDKIPDSHPGKIAFNIFSTNTSETVRGSALQGIQMRFQTFADRAIQEVLSHDGINLSEINTKPSAFFVITSDKSTALKPIASLFFSFLFKDAQDNWDYADGVAKEMGYKSANDPEMPLDCPYRRFPVTVMLDEFFSLGVIGGNPDVFATTMANSRKRLLRVSIILQNYPQLAALYGDNQGRSIQNCCATVVFLGCNDEVTAEFVSSFISGEATVMSESHTETLGIMQRGPGFGNGVTVTSTKRRLLTPDEVRRWTGYVLVTKRGIQPLKLKPFGYINHPCYKNGEMRNVSLESTVPLLWDRVEQLQSEGNSIERVAGSDGTVHEKDVIDMLIGKLKSPKVEELKAKQEEPTVDPAVTGEIDPNDLPDINDPNAAQAEPVKKGSAPKQGTTRGTRSRKTVEPHDEDDDDNSSVHSGGSSRARTRTQRGARKNSGGPKVSSRRSSMDN